jgi:hypothetical protein
MSGTDIATTIPIARYCFLRTSQMNTAIKSGAPAERVK